ncbi:putative acyltransferase [Bradyrhizobium sp. ORS 285]|uniref:acyltransferase family protein n=1 Tax=Bradyrhizobium sp. ORS 285 TaxID=115808 RepID=UPI0002408518|nr:acyltransferase family protein [Bradyrhizobium sp. ORS 285]CCD90338.1 putative acyltransferase [Bradyrhizobium sp. ORS 285]SMX57819.1 putative acyltransferase [Bradyrhizobium sp. ORS 285]
MERSHRADIDALRAIAVVIVVLFHLKIAGFEAGFAGVDVFFVISGYLITGQILRDVGAGRFSLSEFYLRRARRILPALVTTIAGTFAVGWLFLSPEALRQLAKEATHGLLSISNIQYWREASAYFAPTADQLPLLHLWSLSLEVQFYTLAPLLLMWAGRRGQFFRAIATIGLLSLAAAAIWLPWDSEAVFFLTPFRVFEFALGALAIPLEARLASLPRARTIAAACGDIILIGSLVIIGRYQAYAGVAALVPCAAAALIIAANAPTSLVMATPVRAIGTASYSLYLVHWPVIFFAGFIFGDAAQTPVGLAAQLAVMAALAALMFVAVEQPLRRLPWPRWAQVASFATVLLVGAGLTNVTYRANGVASRLPDDQLALFKLQGFGLNKCGSTVGRLCVFGDLQGTRGVELLGDSYVQQYVAALDTSLKTRGMIGHVSTMSGCPTLSGLTAEGPRARACAELRDSELPRIQQSPADFVVIGQAWQNYLDLREGPAAQARNAEVAQRLVETIRLLDRPGRHFLVIGGQVRPVNCAFDPLRMLPGPRWHAPARPCEAVPKSEALAANHTIDVVLGEAIRPLAKVMLLRPSEVYCDRDCPVVEDGVWLFQDAGHFTVAGAQRMGERAAPIFATFLADD